MLYFYSLQILFSINLDKYDDKIYFANIVEVFCILESGIVKYFLQNMGEDAKMQFLKQRITFCNISNISCCSLYSLIKFRLLKGLYDLI